MRRRAARRGITAKSLPFGLERVPSTAIDSFVRKAKPGAYFYLFTVPVIVDLRAGKVHVFEGGTLSSMTWGIAAYPFARQLAQSVMDTWPT